MENSVCVAALQLTLSLKLLLHQKVQTVAEDGSKDPSRMGFWNSQQQVTQKK